MSDTQPVPNNLRRYRIVTISVLVLANIAGGLASATLFGKHSHSATEGCLIGLFFCQTSLVGIWAGLANQWWWLRLLGLITAVYYLSVQFTFLVGGNFGTIFLYVMFTSTSVALVLVAVRVWKTRLTHIDSLQSPTAPSEGIQFSLRHLLLFTFAVAVTLTVGKLMRPLFNSSVELATITALSMCFVLIGLTSVWAMLGRSLVAMRSLLVIVIALATAAIPIWYLHAPEPTEFWIALMESKAVFLLGSLWIVRQCGWQLVALKREQTL